MNCFDWASQPWIFHGSHCSLANLKSTLILKAWRDWLEKFRNLTRSRSHSICWPPPPAPSAHVADHFVESGVPTHFHLVWKFHDRTCCSGASYHTSTLEFTELWEQLVPSQTFEAGTFSPQNWLKYHKSTTWMDEWILLKKFDMFKIGRCGSGSAVLWNSNSLIFKSL